MRKGRRVEHDYSKKDNTFIITKRKDVRNTEGRVKKIRRTILTMQ